MERGREDVDESEMKVCLIGRDRERMLVRVRVKVSVGLSE